MAGAARARRARADPQAAARRARRQGRAGRRHQGRVLHAGTGRELMVAAAFSDPVMAAQAAFRAVLDATARPGKVVTIAQPLAAPAPLAPGAAAIALTLCDHDTPVWLDAQLAAVPAIAEWLRFHTSARITDDATNAAFAFVADALPPFDGFNPGTLEYPDRSTTIVTQVESFAAGVELTLSGPGI